MAMQYIKKTQKFESIRIYDPKQQGHAVTHKFKNHDFVFFNNPNNKGCLIGKGLRPTYDAKGEVVTDFGWEEVVEHFKGMGFKVVELGLDGKPKKKANPNPQKPNENPNENKNKPKEDKK